MKIVASISFLCGLFCACSALAVERPSKCETSGSVLEGNPATITCQFNRLLDTDQQFQLTHESESSPAQIVAVCKWAGHCYECRTFQGFVCKSKTLSKNVMFEVESAETKHSGSYACKPHPASQFTAENCTLTVQGMTFMEPVRCNVDSDDAMVTCSFPESVGRTGILLDVYSGSEKVTAVSCTADGNCAAFDDYTLAEKSSKAVKVRIPGTTALETLTFVCRSATLPHGAEETCSLTPSGDLAQTKEASMKPLMVPLYAIFGCLVVLIVFVAAVLFWNIKTRAQRNSNNDENSSEVNPQVNPQENGSLLAPGKS